MRAGFVAVAGRPNVGKSTLFNSLLGDKVSIVSRRRQTTCYSIRGVVTDQRAQLVLVDTPGWQTRQGGMFNRELNRSVERELPHADAGLLVVEATKLQPDDKIIADFFPPAMTVVAALNKSDRVKRREMSLPVAAELNSWREFAAIVPVSALKGEGIDALKRELGDALPEADPLYPPEQRLVEGEAAYVADFVRESIFHCLGAELPYSAAVEIVRMESRAKGVVLISADLIVDQASRKAIFIGAKGRMLKKIGTAARRSIERFLSKRVHLELFVKVRPNWSKDPAQLQRLLAQRSTKR